VRNKAGRNLWEAGKKQWAAIRKSNENFSTPFYAIARPPTSETRPLLTRRVREASVPISFGACFVSPGSSLLRFVMSARMKSIPTILLSILCYHSSPRAVGQLIGAAPVIRGAVRLLQVRSGRNSCDRRFFISRKACESISPLRKGCSVSVSPVPEMSRST